MIFLLLFLAVILLPLLYVLFAPVFIEIDSTRDLYRVRFHRLASVSVTIHQLSILLHLRIAGWQKQINLMEPGRKAKKAKSEKKNRKKAGNKSVRRKPPFSAKTMMRKMWGVMKSFQIRRCNVIIDTGNYPLNGFLYSWFYLLSQRTGTTLMIGFQGETIVILIVRNTLARMLWAFIRS